MPAPMNVPENGPREEKKKKGKNKAKTQFKGPVNNKIAFEPLLQACRHWLQGCYNSMSGDDLMNQTTLMIKNIPVKFTQKTMLEIIDSKFAGMYNYFYLPMDLKTQCSVGFAFINFDHPIFILRFFLEFQNQQWSNHVPSCKSNKLCDLVYANVQGLDEIKAELRGKEIMKKREQSVRPLFVQTQPQGMQFHNMITAELAWLDNPSNNWK